MDVPLRHRRTAGERGTTLAEVVVSLAIAAIVVGSAASVGLVALRRTSTDASGRTADANAIEMATTLFAGDVRGADAVRPNLCVIAGVVPLVTVRASGSGTLTSYGTRAVGTGSELVRTTCSATGTGARTTNAVAGWRSGLQVACDDVDCDPSRPSPSRIALRGTASGGTELDVTATPRAARTTPVAPPAEIDVLSLGGTRPVEITGNGRLQVVGAMAVASTRSDAIRMSGANARISAGSLTLQTGAGCTGCNATNLVPFPPAFGPVPSDPLAYLPAPDETGLTVRTGSTYQGPGVYTSTLTISSTTTLAPGTYVLRRGLTISGSTQVTGSGVLLFNGCGRNAPPACSPTGSISISGQTRLDLTPPATGRYAGVLIFQDRLNTSAITISGGGQLVSLGGAVYAPAATSFTLGAGGGGMAVAGVIGTNLSITGNGTVRVG